MPDIHKRLDRVERELKRLHEAITDAKLRDHSLDVRLQVAEAILERLEADAKKLHESLDGVIGSP